MAEENKVVPNTNLEYAEHTRDERNEDVLETGNDPKKDVDPADNTTISVQTYEAQNEKREEIKDKQEQVRKEMIADALNDGPQIDADTNAVDGDTVTTEDGEKTE